jgi:glutamate racemase
MIDVDIDTLIMGCTHYPLLEHIIADVMGDKISLINSGRETARTTFEMLAESGLLSSRASQIPSLEGERKFFVSDVPDKFAQVATRFLGTPVENITRIDITKY